MGLVRRLFHMGCFYKKKRHFYAVWDWICACKHCLVSRVLFLYGLFVWTKVLILTRCFYGELDFRTRPISDQTNSEGSRSPECHRRKKGSKRDETIRHGTMWNCGSWDPCRTPSDTFWRWGPAKYSNYWVFFHSSKRHLRRSVCPMCLPWHSSRSQCSKTCNYQLVPKPLSWIKDQGCR